MDTIDMIQNAILNFCEDAKIIPFNNGGIEVRVPDPDAVPAVLSNIADAMFDYGAEDLQITTDQKNCTVYIDIVDREEDDDWDDEEDEDGEEEDVPLKDRIKKGDVINYRSNLVTVLRVYEDGVAVVGPYGEEQKIDWEDVEYFNNSL